MSMNADSSFARTVARETVVTGTGLHTGKEVRVTLRPRDRRGIVFVREDLPGAPEVEASVSNLKLEVRRTVLRNGAAEVQTAEHLLAVLYVFGVDAVEIRLTGSEVPGLDGSSRIWVERIGEGGYSEGPGKRKSVKLTSAVAETEGPAAICAVPCEEGLLVDYILDHGDSTVPVQKVSFAIDPETFARQIAPSRTFVLEKEARALLAAGLGKGATTENTLVVGPEGVRDNTLRFPDEFARHKVLDLLGDLAILGARLEARVVAVRSGHGLNAALVKRIHGALLEEIPDGEPEAGKVAYRRAEVDE